MMNYDYLVDATGDSCPMPLLKAKRQLNAMRSGECLKVIASDEASVRDFSSFIALTNHQLKEQQLEQDLFIYYIVKM